MQIKFNFYLVWFILIIAIVSCNSGNQNINTFQVQNKNSGLIGDQITDFHISPVDSNNWLIQCENRAYLSSNNGLNWQVIDGPRACYRFYFNKNGEVVTYTNKHKSFFVRNLISKSWKEIKTPDSIHSVLVIRTSPEKLYYIYNNSQINKESILFTSTNLNTPLKTINNEQLDSLQDLEFIYRNQKLLDTSIIDLTKGHLYYKKADSYKKVKRMQGINRPEIIALSQNSLNPAEIKLLQFSNISPANGNYFWCYLSENYGESYELIDSSADLKYLIQKYNFNELESKTTDTIHVNDSLLITRSIAEDKLILKNIAKKTEVVYKIQEEEYDLSSLMLFEKSYFDYFTYTKLFKNDSIKFLVANKKGGITELRLAIK